MIKFLDHLALSTQSGFKNYFNFRGKATVSEFWYFTLFFILAYAVVWLVDHFLLTPFISVKDLPYGHFIPAGYLDDEVGLAVLAYRPVMAIPTFSVTVRRLHDVGKSGWWCCLWILPLPVVGWFWLMPWLTRPSTQTTNI
jgi:uncharacterized membrane protein YhaH (DUF805 family)